MRRRALVGLAVTVAGLLVGGCMRAPAPPRSLTPRPGAPGQTEAEPAPGINPADNVYAYASGTTVKAELADVPARVYVPNSDADTVDVIDPATFRVIDHFAVGRQPHHITPSWDLRMLYVNDTIGNSLTPIDPRSAEPQPAIPIVDPYNLYFTPDGSKAIVVAERFLRLDFRDPHSWKLLKSVPIRWPGVDHLDFSADGRYLMASTEYSGRVVKVDTESMTVVGAIDVGGLPVDVKLSPDSSVFYVTNQGRHGVSILDAGAMKEIGFIATGRGAHGLQVSRDTRLMYVSNRLEGTISVIDLSTRQLRDTWVVGGSPDMFQLSPDGRQLWVSNRFYASVSVIDTATGRVIGTIPTGAGAHGLTYFPQPGRFSLGHNGVYR
jgi:YVTN family beta-propeller protein